MAVVDPAFKINGITIASPTESGYEISSVKGTDGSGQKRYNPFYEYNLEWNYLPQDELQEIYNAWIGTYGSGTVSCQIPQHNSSTYQFVVYSGVMIDQPEVANYQDNFVQGVKIKIRKISI